MNSGASWPTLGTAQARVLDHQRKLHRWARSEPARRFDDVFNLVCDRATLTVAWERVISNRGAKTAGVDGVTRLAVKADDVVPFLEELRSSLREGSFVPLPVRQTSIPKKGGKRRTLGIPTLRDRVAQMALKLILEPIFEVDFYPSSYGYRAGRRAQDPTCFRPQLEGCAGPTEGADLEVHVILDNLSAHKTPTVQKWLLGHKRFHLHFTPTYGSWMNLVERWFSALTTKKLRRSAHRSVKELAADITAWADTWNENPTPFVWHKSAEQILERLAGYCAAINEDATA